MSAGQSNRYKNLFVYTCIFDQVTVSRFVNPLFQTATYTTSDTIFFRKANLLIDDNHISDTEIQQEYNLYLKYKFIKSNV